MAIKKIVLTGGPCGGKSSALTRIGEVFSNHGWRVLFVPESATELITGGISPLTCASNENFQIHILKLQRCKEQLYMSVAEKMSYENILIVCDRGALDNKVYMNTREFYNVLTANNTSEKDLLDDYDAVFHLETAAKGALHAYTLSNNKARRETPEEAVKLDDDLIKAWKNHPHLRIIDNSTDFKNKIRRLIQEIAVFLGESGVYATEKKFLVKMPDKTWLENQNNFQKMEITQTFLLTTNENEEKCLRRLNLNDQILYTLRFIKLVPDAKPLVHGGFLQKDSYLSLLSQADPTKKTIHKTRYSFILKKLYLEVDIFSFWQDKAIVRIAPIEKNVPLELPSEFSFIKEVTGEEKYTSAALARNHSVE